MELPAGPLLAAVLRRAHVLAPAQLAPLLAEEAARAGLDDVRLYVTDYSQERLVPLAVATAADSDAEAVHSLPIDGSLVGEAYRRLDVLATERSGRTRLFVPVLAGMERLGVLQADLRETGEPEALRQCAVDLASLAGELLLSKGRHSDHLERARRLGPMSLAAEMQWALLPPLTFGSEGLVISGLLEPCYEVGGDAFDYSLDAGEAAVGIFDAMGHGVEASLLSSLTVGAYRNSRRIGHDLRDTFREIDRVLRRHRDGEGFVTGILGRLDIATGRFRWLTAGHLPPLVLRGGKVVKTLDREPVLPLGLGGDPPEPFETQLEPGDRLLLVTDGIVEARSPDGEFFGPDRLVEFVRKAIASGYPAAEALRRLKREILSHRNGDLRDDATILFVEWRSPDASGFHR